MLYYIIKKPLMTEKNSQMAEDRTYVFEVDASATRTEIKKAVEKYFRVKVDSVRTLVGRGRVKRTKMGVSDVRYWKKAMVKLALGEKISLFEGA